MIKVAALTSGKTVPSARFRVRQHVAPLRRMGIDVREYIPAVQKYAPAPMWMRHLTDYGLPGRLAESGWRVAKRATRLEGVIGSWQAQVTWLERLLLPGRLSLEGMLKRPLVFDVDDAIWLLPPGGKDAVAAVARRADVVVAGNDYIADWFSPLTRRVCIVPTAVDTERLRPARKENASPFTVGWIGTSSNLPYLEAVEAPLLKFFAEHVDSRLLIVSNSAPSFRTLPSDRVRYIPWSEDGEAEALREMDVGLMPLPDNEWTRGKCAFKMLLYMATGIPAVVSPVGMNREILDMGTVGIGADDDDSWYEALSLYHGDPRRKEADGREGRSIAERKFSNYLIAEALSEIFRELS
jgi:glycosyltransferase involved in cell wall biosynthesis